MRSARRCSRTACGRPAAMTLTYVYSDQTAVLGPLSTTAEPHAYDLCEQHSERLSAPRGWEVLRLANVPVGAGPSDDDLLALADAVREAAVRPAPAPSRPPHVVGPQGRDEPFDQERRPSAPSVQGAADPLDPLDPFDPRDPRSDHPGRPPRHGGVPRRGGHLRVLDTDPTLL
ncbi:DUF3499 domain-containing protein [Nocardioides sp. ChNu-99]|uniref:DUF3499 domain-containing protein n=1 Tax=Nocardioides sp. ChNu-99 TaxID=2839897 RepID=UPI0024054E02|nr:DUF3499 domain-containing protein [Nocardioides sp. ChNu-99]MDF9717557.1 DUF3499 domain-containing protein [Nocardioides sp. ChNu-99]